MGGGTPLVFVLSVISINLLIFLLSVLSTQRLEPGYAKIRTWLGQEALKIGFKKTILAFYTLKLNYLPALGYASVYYIMCTSCILSI